MTNKEKHKLYQRLCQYALMMRDSHDLIADNHRQIAQRWDKHCDETFAISTKYYEQIKEDEK